MTSARRLPFLNARLQGFGTSIFSEMTQLAVKHSAVNLGQGFPNFSGPKDLLQVASDSIVKRELNQYSRSFGLPQLTSSIKNRFKLTQNLEYNDQNEITVFSGATEAIFAIFASVLELGDEVIIFEPHYDSYRPSINAAGGKEKIITLRKSAQDQRFTFDKGELTSAISPKTKAILINSPNNPTGSVFTNEELAFIADLCIKHDCIAVSDEVYEYIVFDGLKHKSIASFPGMKDRTITISSAGKTFSVTGWKIGWALASKDLTNAIRTSHQFITFCSATPFQYAIADALNFNEEFFEDLRSSYENKRNKLCSGLEKIGFKVIQPQGTYFTQVDVSDMCKSLKIKGDVEFCKFLVEKLGVCGIPSSAFYSWNISTSYVRFAFCKTDDVLEEALERLKRI